ncbi:MAG: NADH-quinone oxidoreductase subunit J [Planctomycetales bacterium]|nr:NADH-quinone oxidoreductase subunit J [Planctomycetales bacterium]
MIAPVLAAGVNWHAFFFLLFALVSCGMALAVLFTSNIVRMAFYLTISLGAVAGLFMLAGAHFVGAMQLMIYVGGTLVLLIFGVMLTAQSQFVEMKTPGGEWVLAAIVGGALLTVLLAAALSVPGWRGPSETQFAAAQAMDVSSDGTAIGAGLMGLRTDALSQSDPQLRQGMSGYLLQFEIVSVHLLVVLIGAAYLARARQHREGHVSRRAPQVDSRRRNGLVTAVLLVVFALHAGCAAACFVGGPSLHAIVPGLETAESWLWPALGVCCAVDAALLLIVLNWQRWAYWALVVAALVECAVLYSAHAAPLTIVGTLALAAIWLALLMGLLRLGGSQSMWAQME